MDYSLQIQKLLVKVEALASPDDKIKLLKEATQLADSHNDIEWGFDLRIDLILEEKGTSRCIESMPALTWLLDTQERHSDIFQEKEFMLEYKWMLAAARRNASISIPQLTSIFNDYKARLQRNGYTLHSYYSALTQLAFMTNDLQTAKQYIALREKEDHDDLSYCVACEINDQVELEFRLNNIDNALMLATDLFSHKVDCKYVPFETFCNCINRLVAAGYANKAAECFAKADEQLQTVENETSNIGHISELIKYLASVNKDAAWAYFEKYAGWSVGCEDYFMYQFAKNVLPLLKDEGTRKLQATSLMPWYKQGNIYEIKDLYNYYKNQASNLAQHFDQRHDTTCFTDQLSF